MHTLPAKAFNPAHTELSDMIQTTAEKTTRQDDAHLAAPSATPEPTLAVADVAGDLVNVTLEALADVVCEALGDGDVVENGGDSIAVFAGESAQLNLNARGDAEAIAGNMEGDMRALAAKLTDAANAIHNAERERRSHGEPMAAAVNMIRRVLDQKLAAEYGLEIIDDESGGARLSVNFIRRCGVKYGSHPVLCDVIAFLRQSAGRLATAAVAIEEASGQTPGVLLYEVEPYGRQIRCSDFEGVGFIVDDADTEAEAMAQVRELLAGLQVAGVTG